MASSPSPPGCPAPPRSGERCQSLHEARFPTTEEAREVRLRPPRRSGWRQRRSKGNHEHGKSHRLTTKMFKRLTSSRACFLAWLSLIALSFQLLAPSHHLLRAGVDRTISLGLSPVLWPRLASSWMTASRLINGPSIRLLSISSKSVLVPESTRPVRQWRASSPWPVHSLSGYIQQYNFQVSTPVGSRKDYVCPPYSTKSSVICAVELHLRQVGELQHAMLDWVSPFWRRMRQLCAKNTTEIRSQVCWYLEGLAEVDCSVSVVSPTTASLGPTR